MKTTTRVREVRCSANGERVEFNEAATMPEIAEELRSQGWIGSVEVRDAAGFTRGWVSVDERGEKNWRNA